LVEVEVRGEVTQHGGVLAHGGAGVGTAVSLGIETAAAEEVVFDELQVGVVTEGRAWRRG
jgi:hypothetical protein